MKKKILFVIDIPDWAYHNIAKELSKHLQSDYEIYYVSSNDYLLRKNRLNKFWSKIFNFYSFVRFGFYKALSINKKIYFAKKNIQIPKFTKTKVFKINTNKEYEINSFDYLVEMAYYFQYTCEFPFKFRKKIVGLYTDSFPHEGNSIDLKKEKDVKELNRDEFYNHYIRHYDGLIVGSQNLFNYYEKYNHPIALVNSIYRADEFQENKQVGENEYLTIGWTGNPNRMMKGFREIIEPAINNLIGKGLKIKLKTRFTGDYEGLLSFYTDVDLICIASKADTGPSLFAEASLSKVPALTTEIGFPKMIIKNGKNGFFVERDIHEFETKITELYYNRELLKQMSNQIKKDYLDKLNNEELAINLKNILVKLD